ncbi:MAG TPA: carbohydrate ABC transporter permease, partial [Acidilobales archaeon]|nr:carbohydrate ABC transporter permease [Acidilobales archaeon]
MVNEALTKYYLRRIVVSGLVLIATLWVMTPFVISIIYAFADPVQYH